MGIFAWMFGRGEVCSLADLHVPPHRQRRDKSLPRLATLHELANARDVFSGSDDIKIDNEATIFSDLDTGERWIQARVRLP